MRRKSLLLSVVLLLVPPLLSSCIVVSIHPFVRRDQAVTPNSVVGRWQPLDEDGTPIQREWFEVTREDPDSPFYRIIHREQPDEGKEAGKEKREEEPLVGLFWERNGTLYLDAVRETDDLFLLPAHALHRLRIEGDRLELAVLDIDYLREVREKNLGRIPGLSTTLLGDDRLVITSPTEEIQAWLASWEKDPKLFHLLGRFVRKK